MFSPKPLSTRLDSLAQPWEGEREIVPPWLIPAKTGGAFQFPYPAYSRILHASSLSEGLPEALAFALADLGFPWLDTAELSVRNNLGRIVSIDCDIPIDSEALRRGSALQFQFYGVPYQHLAPSKFMRWNPLMPIELDTIEQLASKLEAVRTCVSKGVPVGAAIVAKDQGVYEDVRLLLDCGFDWIELIQAPCFDLVAGASLTLGDLELVLSRALKARQDARSNSPIWLTSDQADPKVWLRWLERGIQGVSIDAFLAAKRPASSVPLDTLAGIRVQSVRSAKDHGWILAALSELRSFLLDALSFRI